MSWGKLVYGCFTFDERLAAKKTMPVIILKTVKYPWEDPHIVGRNLGGILILTKRIFFSFVLFFQFFFLKKKKSHNHSFLALTKSLQINARVVMKKGDGIDRQRGRKAI